MQGDGPQRSGAVKDDVGEAGPGRRWHGRRGIWLGAAVVGLLGVWVFVLAPLTGTGGTGDGTPGPTGSDEGLSTPARFATRVLHDTEATWTNILRAQRQVYEPPQLQLFRDRLADACEESIVSGPFYCPQERQLYVDLAFLERLGQQFDAPVGWAPAYVIAHGVGHHVQQQLGIHARLEAARRRANDADAHALAQRFELQADCFVGVWAHHSPRAREWLERGDLQVALRAIEQAEDETLRGAMPGTRWPDRFERDMEAPRQAWFRRGYFGGRLRDCNTFDAKQP